MIQHLTWIETENTWPYRNLAMEEYMTTHVEKGECILFLWQNRRTVVIGKNQNCWKECRVGALEEDGGFLARRLSGGGAVFHDLGNLNFTFIARQANYSVDRQLQVIIAALEKLGIHSEKTGRNDVTVDGRKFSGNAFYQSGDYCCHHGTLLVNVDSSLMARYLNVSREKLAAKGVSSVRSRVVNLRELRPELTITQLKEALVDAFSQVYGLNPRRMEETELPGDEISRLTGRFASDQWKYGRKMAFDYQLSRRFGWGDIQLQLHVDKGVVLEAAAYSDAMDQEFIGLIPQALKGCVCGREGLWAALDGMAADGRSRDGALAAGGTVARCRDDGDEPAADRRTANCRDDGDEPAADGRTANCRDDDSGQGTGGRTANCQDDDRRQGTDGLISGGQGWDGGHVSDTTSGDPRHALFSQMLSDIKDLISESF